MFLHSRTVYKSIMTPSVNIHCLDSITAHAWNEKKNPFVWWLWYVYYWLMNGFQAWFYQFAQYHTCCTCSMFAYLDQLKIIWDSQATIIVVMLKPPSEIIVILFLKGKEKRKEMLSIAQDEVASANSQWQFSTEKDKYYFVSKENRPRKFSFATLRVSLLLLIFLAWRMSKLALENIELLRKISSC